MPPAYKRKHVATGRPVGRPSGSPDAPLPSGLTKTTTTKTSYERTSTPTTQGILDALKSVSTSPLSRWLEKMYTVPGVEEIAIEKTHRGKVVEVGKIKPGEWAPDQAVELFITNWREGEYHLRILHEGDYVGTRRTLIVGGIEAIDRERVRGERSTMEDAQAEFAEIMKMQAAQAQLALLKQATGGGEADEMKPEQLLMLANAMKQEPPKPTDLTPILTIMEQSRREAAERAERLETRNHELQLRMLDAANAAKKDETSTGLAALTALLPHAQGLLDNPLVKGFLGRFFARTPEPAGGWTPESIMGIISTVVNAAGPYIGPLIQSAMAKAAQPAENPAMPHAPALPAPTMPPPQNGGTPAMPNPITDVLIEELRKAPDDRNPEQLSRFLATVFVTPGVTLLGLFEELSDMDERFAKASITGQPGLFDPRLADAQTWPGVVAFFAFIREEAQKAEEEAKRAGGE